MTTEGADLRDTLTPPKDPVQILSPPKPFYDPTLEEEELWPPIAAGRPPPVWKLCMFCGGAAPKYVNDYFFCRHLGPCQQCYDKRGLHKEEGLGRCPRCSKIVTKWVEKGR